MIQVDQRTAATMTQIERLLAGFSGPPEDADCAARLLKEFRGAVHATAINKRFGTGSAGSRTLLVEVDGQDEWWQILISSCLTEILDLRLEQSLYSQTADKLDAWAARISEAARELRRAEAQQP